MKIYSASLARKYKLPLTIILVGVLYSLYLQLQISDEVFFSGDAGLKLLLTKQFASGKFQIDLDLPVESWVGNLWANGLYPFEPPFAFHLDNRYYIQYHFIYPLINAPFYALLGWRGLYIIPLVSTWIIWWRFYVVCQSLRLGITSTSLGLATLIFASPLSLYSAMYWEHAITLSMAFYGLSIILIPSSEELSNRKAILSGILIGLSVWFRQELICLVGAVCVLFYATKNMRRTFKKKITVIVSMLLTIALFLLLNTIYYHHPLGVYSFPDSLPAGINSLVVSEEINDSEASKGFFDFAKIETELMFFVKTNGRVVFYLPITIFTTLYILWALFSKKITSRPYILFLALICFLISFTPAVIGWSSGKEWGPRYVLIMFLLIPLIATMALNSLIRVGKFNLRYISIASFLFLFAVGSYINTYLGTRVLSRDYAQRVLPALKVLQKNQNTAVAVSDQSISQELAATFGEKVFFLTKTNNDLKRLASVLVDQGHQQFLYVVAQDHKEKVDSLEFTSRDRPFAIKFSPLGEFGSYVVYQASLIKPSAIALKP